MYLFLAAQDLAVMRIVEVAKWVTSGNEVIITLFQMCLLIEEDRREVMEMSHITVVANFKAQRNMHGTPIPHHPGKLVCP